VVRLIAGRGGTRRGGGGRVIKWRGYACCYELHGLSGRKKKTKQTWPQEKTKDHDLQTNAKKNKKSETAEKERISDESIRTAENAEKDAGDDVYILTGELPEGGAGGAMKPSTGSRSGKNVTKQSGGKRGRLKENLELHVVR